MSAESDDASLGSLGSTSEETDESRSSSRSGGRQRPNDKLVQTPDDELAVWPKKIHFLEPWIEGEQVQKLKLTNECFKQVVAYRILVTSSEMYSIKPKAGFIKRGKCVVATIKLKHREKVKKLDDQGLQIETLYWQGKKLDKADTLAVYKHFKGQRAPHAILQRVRIYFPPDIAHNIPEKRRTEDE